MTTHWPCMRLRATLLPGYGTQLYTLTFTQGENCEKNELGVSSDGFV